jgi:hypothetical protein
MARYKCSAVTDILILNSVIAVFVVHLYCLTAAAAGTAVHVSKTATLH